MLIIGELINASRKEISAAIEARDTKLIEKVALGQAKAGADYIDVNAGIFMDKEIDHVKWLVATIQSVTDKPCAIDSPNPRVIEAGMAVHRGTPMINSISLEKQRYESLLPVIAGTDCKVIALCMRDAGMPETVDDRMRVADALVNGLLKHHVKLENILVDPLVQPLSVNNTFGMAFVKSIEHIMTRFKGIHTTCGLSNISYGLPERKRLNRTFMVMAIAAGLDSAIVNPLDKNMMANILMAEALAGRDYFCMNYLKAYRAGLFA